MLALEAGASSRLELGDITGFETDTAELVQLSNELRSPLDQSFATMWRAVRALLNGNFAEVEEIAGQLYPYAHENGAWSKRTPSWYSTCSGNREDWPRADLCSRWPWRIPRWPGSMPLPSSCISGSATTTPWPVTLTSGPPTASPASPRLDPDADHVVAGGGLHRPRRPGTRRCAL